MTARVVRERIHRHRLDRCRLALAEPLGRVVQRRLRDVEELNELLEAQGLAADYRGDYNDNHHHSPLGNDAGETRRSVNPELSAGVDR